MIHINDEISIDEKEIEISAIRGAGPGGQNVNKVATAVQLRFDIKNSPSLPPNTKEKLIDIAGRRVTKEGILVIEARQFRSQQQNIRDALDRLIRLVRQASKRPKTRKKSRPSAAAKQRRLEDKRHRSQTKRLRQTVSSTDDDV